MNRSDRAGNIASDHEQFSPGKAPTPCLSTIGWIKVRQRLLEQLDINPLAVGCIHNSYRRNAGYRFNTPITSVLSSSELLQTLSDSSKSTISASPSLTDRSSFAYENTGRKKRSYGVNSPFVLRRPAR